MKTYKEYLNEEEKTLVRAGDVVKEIDIEGFEPIGPLLGLGLINKVYVITAKIKNKTIIVHRFKTLKQFNSTLKALK